MAKKSAWDEALNVLGSVGNSVSSFVSNLGRNAINSGSQAVNNFTRTAAPQINSAARTISSIGDYVGNSGRYSPIAQARALPQAFPVQNFANTIAKAAINTKIPTFGFSPQNAVNFAKGVNFIANPPKAGPGQVAPNYSLSTRVLTSLPQVPNVRALINAIPEAKFNRFNTGNQAGNFVSNLPIDILEGTINTPKHSFNAAANIGEGIARGETRPSYYLGNAAEAAMLPFTVATFGQGAALKEIGKQSLKQALLKTTMEGGKLGLVFGTLQGLGENKDAPTIKAQIERTIPYALVGLGTGGLLGPISYVGAKGIGTAAQYISPAIRRLFLESRQTGGIMAPNELRAIASNEMYPPTFRQWAQGLANFAEQTGKDIHLNITGETPTTLGKVTRLGKPKSDYNATLVDRIDDRLLPGMAAEAESNAAPQISARTLALNEPNPIAPREILPTRPLMQESVTLADDIARMADDFGVAPQFRTLKQQVEPMAENDVKTVEAAMDYLKSKTSLNSVLQPEYKRAETVFKQIARDYLGKDFVDNPNTKIDDIMAAMDERIAFDAGEEGAPQLIKQMAESPEELQGVAKSAVAGPQPAQFRQVPSEGFNTEKELAQQTLEKIFSKDEIGFITKDVGEIITPDGQIATGKYFNNMISVVEQGGKVQDKDVYHEAFHAYVDKFVDKEVYKQALSEAKGTGQFKSEKEANEWFAESFAEWMQGKQGFTGKVVAFFENLLNQVKGLIGKKDQVQQIYYDMMQGKKPTQSTMPSDPEAFRIAQKFGVSPEEGAQVDNLSKTINQVAKDIAENDPDLAKAILSDEDLAMKALNESRGYTPDEMKPMSPEDLGFPSPLKAENGNIPSDWDVAVKQLNEGRAIREAQLQEAPIAEASTGLPEVPEGQSFADIINENPDNGFLSNPGQAGDFDSLFKQWIGKRDVARTTGTEVAAKFKNIPKDAAEAVINEIESPGTNTDPKIAEMASSIKTEYDRLFQDAQKSGIDIRYLENYITHIWDKSPGEVKEIFAKARDQFPYAQERTIPTYAEGKALGLEAMYEHPAEILAHYVRNLEQTKANINFLKGLQDNKVVVSREVGAPLGYQRIDAEGLMPNSNLYAPSEVAKLVNQVFNPRVDGGKVARGLELGHKGSSIVQDITMSGGLPYTPANAFVFAQITKEMLSGRIVSPWASAFRAVSTGSANKFFENHLGSIKEMQAHNVPVNTSYEISNLVDDGVFGKLFGGDVGGAVKQAWGKAVNDPTFKRFMPMLQVSFYEDAKRSALKAGKSIDEAQRIAADATKNFYGVITSDDAAKRNKMTEDFLGAILFAPKYRESMWRFWVNNLKTLRHPFSPEYAANAKFIVGATATLIAMDQVNRAFNNGRSILDNPPGTEDKLLIPLGDGYTMGIPFLSSIATVPRALGMMTYHAAKGDFPQVMLDAKSFASAAYRPILDVLTNENYRGAAIYDESDSQGERYAKIGKFLASEYNHPYIEALMQSNGKPGYQTASAALETPFRFYEDDKLMYRYHMAESDELRDSLSPDSRIIWDKIKNTKTVDEDGVPVFNRRSYMANALDTLAHPEVLRAKTQLEQDYAAKTGEQINPFYNLSPKQQETVLLLKTFYPGDKQDTPIINANIEWLKPYWSARDQYNAQYQAKLKEKGITVQSDDLRPKTTPELQQKLDLYNTLPSGTGARTRFLKANPDVLQFFTDSRNYTNMQRADLGLPLLADSYGSGGGFGSKPKSPPKLKVPKVAKSNGKVKISIPKLPNIQYKATNIGKPKTSKLTLKSSKIPSLKLGKAPKLSVKQNKIL